jgi:glyoxylase-like metal-dependent hydrolase (beta-lactamase superfamily II)
MVTLVAPGIYQIRLPLPFALNHVNCYLLQEDEGWTLVDTGLNWPEGQRTWRAVFVELQIGFGDIRRIVLTHMHPDHFGLAGWFQAKIGQAIWLSPREAELAQTVWVENGWRPECIAAYWRMGGITPAVAEVVSVQTAALRVATLPHPTRIKPIEAGESITMGGRVWRAIHAPGHSDGQLIFYDAADRLLLSGDQVLLKITPNIGLWPSTEPEPLARYLASLDDLAKLDVRLALPGHRQTVLQWCERIEELRAHHAVRLTHAYDAVGSEGATALEVSRHLFDFDRFSRHEVRFAIAEALAHLEYLMNLGELTYEETSVRIYRRAQ